MEPYLITRRRFLQQSSLAMAGLTVSGGLGSNLFAANAGGVSILVSPSDTLAGSIPPQWAISQLRQAIQGLGVVVQMISDISLAPVGDQVVVVSSRTASLATQIGGNIPTTPEAIALIPGTLSGRSVLLASGNDARGLVYTVLELTDRVLYSSSVAGALTLSQPLVEESHNQVRSICRSFESELEDKPWFNDRAFWTEYLSTLAAERVNRFNLSFGLGYNFGNPASSTPDDYLLFVYPFLVSVGGVSVSGVSAAERDANLATLKFISDETVKRGMDFQLGLWCHSIVYTNGTHALQGLATTNGGTVHANYCRDALSAILTACPNISGLTIRVHNESGIPTGNYTFWQTLFTAVTPFVNAGRPLEIDMHAKECRQAHIDAAVAARAKAVVSPKKWAEHQGLPYHQASLRPSERSTDPDHTLLNGQASRYGYANFFKENRNYGILHRLWPGTQRHLLWADPVFAAGYGRSSSFCGSLGIELYEPLSFKGREGSGVAEERNSYVDGTLVPTYDFQKSLLYYRIFCRCLYNPDTDPQTWKRYYTNQFGAGGGDVEDALGNASRILMLVSTVHGASADNHVYWTEMYTNFSIVDGQPTTSDSNNPLRLATSFDPQLFLDVDDYAEALLSGNEYMQDKYLPVEFCQWVEDFANAAATRLAAAAGSVPNRTSPEYRRIDLDVTMQSKLGLFFGSKFRSAVLWSLYRKTNDANAKTQALAQYNIARQRWTELATLGAAYKTLHYGSTSGRWSDRTAAITSDINAMNAASFTTVTAITTHPGAAAAAIATALGRPNRPVSGAAHTQPSIFTPGTAVALTVTVDINTTAARMYYRHVNQADTWQSVIMTKSGNSFQASIPGAYTQTNYPLQYYFALAKGTNRGALLPGFDATLTNQPYYILRTIAATSIGAERTPLTSSLPSLGNIAVFQMGQSLEIHYSLNRSAPVSGHLFDMNGKLMAAFTDENQTAGPKVRTLNPSGGPLSSGEYVLQLASEGFKISKPVRIAK